MKRIFLIVALLSAMAAAQTTTTYTGTIKDLGGATVTSGKIMFDLQPSIDVTISSNARFTPLTVTCLINATGNPVAQSDGVSACVATNNTALTPSGTSYKVSICPYNACTSTFVTYALGGSVDITTVVPTPAELPAYSFLDLSSTQTISGSKTWSAVQVFKNGATSQANWPGTATVTPQSLDVESGSSSSPTTGMYLSKPLLLLSRYDATTIAACESGLLNLCAAPLARIAFSNISGTTMSTPYGLIVEGSRFAANTQGSDAAHNYPVGIGIALRDASTPNVVNMAGIDNNQGVNSVPTKCHFGVAGGVNTNCGRVSNGMETNQSVSVATDGTVDETQIGNLVYGQTINLNSPGGGNGSYALNITTNTSGKGWQFGVGIGGALQTGLVIPQQGSSFKPSIGMHIASQGPYGLICGTGSTSYTHSAIWTFGNPSIACLLLDVQRAEGATSAAGSNFLQWRSATGAATYQNFRAYLGTANDWHMQSDASGAWADVMQLVGNATPAVQSVSVTGSFIASSSILFKNTGGNSFTLTGTPTGTDVWTFQDTLADTVVGRATTDTFTGSKTFSQPIISSVATGTAPFTVASTTNVANLNASSLSGATFAAPGAIGGGTPGTVAATSVTVGGDTAFTKAPRMTFTCQIASLNGVATYCSFVTEQPITLTRIYIQQITGSTGCATFPVVSAFNSTGSAILSSVTESAATSIDSGAVSVAVATAQTVSVRVTTAGVTCSPTAANVNVTLQYKMQ